MAKTLNPLLRRVCFRAPAGLLGLFKALCFEAGDSPAIGLEKAVAFWLRSGGRLSEASKWPKDGQAWFVANPLGRCASDIKRAAAALGVEARDVALGALVLWVKSGGDGGRAWADLYDLGEGVRR